MSYPILWFHAQILRDISHNPDIKSESILRGTLSGFIAQGKWPNNKEITDKEYELIKIKKDSSPEEITNQVKELIQKEGLQLFPNKDSLLDYIKENREYFDDSLGSNEVKETLQYIYRANFEALRKRATAYIAGEGKASIEEEDIINKYKEITPQVINKDNIKYHNFYLKEEGYNQYLLDVIESEEEKKKKEPEPTTVEPSVTTTTTETETGKICIELTEDDKDALDEMYYGYFICEYKLNEIDKELKEIIRKFARKSREELVKIVRYDLERFSVKIDSIREIDNDKDTFDKYAKEETPPLFAEVENIYEKLTTQSQKQSLKVKFDSNLLGNFSPLFNLVRASALYNSKIEFT